MSAEVLAPRMTSPVGSVALSTTRNRRRYPHPVSGGPPPSHPTGIVERMSEVENQPHRNEVHLVGRVSGAAQATVLPSGDEVVGVRIVVERDGPARTPRSPRVDTIECAAWSAGIRRRIRRWAHGEVVEIRGMLRRRFRRGGAGVESRYEVEIVEARKV